MIEHQESFPTNESSPLFDRALEDITAEDLKSRSSGDMSVVQTKFTVDLARTVYNLTDAGNFNGARFFLDNIKGMPGSKFNLDALYKGIDTAERVAQGYYRK